MFSKYFVAICQIKPLLALDEQICVGLSIFDLSKLLMYEFQYKYIGRKHYNQSKLLFTNKDCLTVWFMEWKQIMFMEISKDIKICLILVIIHKFQHFLILSLKK